jgi:hypothetical protein
MEKLGHALVESMRRVIDDACPPGRCGALADTARAQLTKLNAPWAAPTPVPLRDGDQIALMFSTAAGPARIKCDFIKCSVFAPLDAQGQNLTTSIVRDDARSKKYASVSIAAPNAKEDDDMVWAYIDTYTEGVFVTVDEALLRMRSTP